MAHEAASLLYVVLFLVTSQMTPLIFYHSSISMASEGKKGTLENEILPSPFSFSLEALPLQHQLR